MQSLRHPYTKCNATKKTIQTTTATTTTHNNKQEQEKQIECSEGLEPTESSNGSCRADDEDNGDVKC